MKPPDEQQWKEITEPLIGILRELQLAVKLVARGLPIHPRINSINEDHDSAERSEGGDPEQPFLFVRAINRDTPEREAQLAADSDRHFGLQWSMLRWQQALCLATIAAFLAAAYYACVAKQQKETMDKTFGEIKKQTGFAERSAVGAEDAARAAQSAVAQARAQFREDERPYVALNPVGTQMSARLVDSGEHARHLLMQFQFTNYGKSPAIEIGRDARIAVGIKEVRSIRLHSPAETLIRIIPPNDKPLVFAYSDSLVTPEMFNDIRAGKIITVLYGHIEYTDLLSDPRPKYETEFCTPVVSPTEGHDEANESARATYP